MILNSRTVKLTTRSGTDIHRSLPHRQIRTIGAWCFADHFGPTSQEGAMSVAAHPHVGLQTVSWLFEGVVEHRDSLGSVQVIKPGELNLMTAGHGVAHSELSLPDATYMHGVQLWTVLPDGARDTAPLFDHYQDLPKFNYQGLEINLFMGELMGHRSPARSYSEMVGAEINIAAQTSLTQELREEYEYGFLLVEGDLKVGSDEVPLESIFYSAAGRTQIELGSLDGAKIILLGGVPFPEEILMWWNFIGRSHEEIVQMRSDWNNQTARFPDFVDQIHGRIPAPELPNLKLQARGNN